MRHLSNALAPAREEDKIEGTEHQDEEAPEGHRALPRSTPTSILPQDNWGRKPEALYHSLQTLSLPFITTANSRGSAEFSSTPDARRRPPAATFFPASSRRSDCPQAPKRSRTAWRAPSVRAENGAPLPRYARSAYRAARAHRSWSTPAPAPRACRAGGRRAARTTLRAHCRIRARKCPSARRARRLPSTSL